MPNVRDEITDPAILIDLLDQYRERAQDLAYELNPEADDPPPVVSCTIPVKVRGGDTIEVSGTAPGVWALGLLETYVGLPERFRGYWRQMATAIGTDAHITEVLDTSKGYGIFDLETTITIPYQTSSSPLSTGTVGAYRVSGALDPSLQDVSVPDPAAEEPTWSGVWPSGYYYNTIPQLVDALSLLNYAGNSSPAIPPFYYDGLCNLHAAAEYLQPELLHPQGARFDFLQYGASLGMFVYLRNYSDAPVSVPFSVIAGGSASCQVYNGINSNEVDWDRNWQSLTGGVADTIVVQPGETIRVNIGGSDGVWRQTTSELADWNSKPPLGENLYMSLVVPFTIAITIGDWSLSHTFPPPGGV